MAPAKSKPKAPKTPKAREPTIAWANMEKEKKAKQASLKKAMDEENANGAGIENFDLVARQSAQADREYRKDRKAKDVIKDIYVEWDIDEASEFIKIEYLIDVNKDADFDAASQTWVPHRDPLLSLKKPELDRVLDLAKLTRGKPVVAGQQVQREANMRCGGSAINNINGRMSIHDLDRAIGFFRQQREEQAKLDEDPHIQAHREKAAAESTMRYFSSDKKIIKKQKPGRSMRNGTTRGMQLMLPAIDEEVAAGSQQTPASTHFNTRNGTHPAQPGTAPSEAASNTQPTFFAEMTSRPKK